MVGTQLLITLHADRRRLAEQSLILVDEVEMKERYVRQVRPVRTCYAPVLILVGYQVLAGRRRADDAARDAEQRLGRIRGQVDRLWTQLSPVSRPAP